MSTEHDGASMSEILLTDRQIRLLITWSASRELFPDEERLRRKLKLALEENRTPTLSRIQIKILYAWAEQWFGGHYGGGEVVNPDEEEILRKIRAALGWD
jgi:hypothetical protein